MPLPIYDLSKPAGRAAYERRVEELRSSASSTGDNQAAQAVAGIVEDVRKRGDAAVVDYMRKWTDPRFTAERIAVSPRELSTAARNLDKTLRKVIESSIQNVREYQRHIRPKDAKPVTIAGATLGLRFTAVESAGLLVPGGRAAYPSSVIMLAVPAIEAGVPASAISVASPPPTRRAGETNNAAPSGASDISPLVLATCAMLGIEKVYRIGGAQAVAALAFGTQRVSRVDMLAGPGNVFVQLAKSQLNGRVGTDNGFYGPSEIVTIADDSANVACVAADLIAQAEHDPGRCFLVSWSRRAVTRIAAEVAAQSAQRKRRAAIDQSLEKWSAAIIVKDRKQAIEVANELAAEHVNLAVKDAEAMLREVRHGGEFFLGDQTPVAAGDYFAGPSHCLPTGTTARFASGVSVYTFLKRSGTVRYAKGMPAGVADAIARFAEAEGLDGHAASARVRAK